MALTVDVRTIDGSVAGKQQVMRLITPCGGRRSKKILDRIRRSFTEIEFVVNLIDIQQRNGLTLRPVQCGHRPNLRREPRVRQHYYFCTSLYHVQGRRMVRDAADWPC